MKKALSIVLDAGHGLISAKKYDPGAVSEPLKEATLTLDFVGRLARLLKDGFSRHDWRITLTRPHDGAKASLADRVAIANKTRHDLFVSIHFNASPNRKARGFEVWTTVGKTASDDVAEKIIDVVGSDPTIRATLRVDKSDGDRDKERDFYVLRKTKCPAVLVELAFITNQDEMLAFIARRESYAQAIARAIARAIEEAFV